jgi:sirohydrochlorin cobaltochelatase
LPGAFRFSRFFARRNAERRMSEKLGLMICGHGSRDQAAIAEFAALAERLRPRFPEWPVEHGYLEFARPVIREGLDKLVGAGASRILAVPGMLFAAGHAKNDIPSVLNTYQAGHRGLTIEYGRELGLDARMIQAAGARVREALNGAEDVPLHDTLLVVVGRGASDPDANSNVAKVTRMLWEGFGFGWAETAYSGVTFPLVEPALEKAARLGFRRIVVFPYFLFTGILVDRIYAATDAVAKRHPEIAFLKAPYLSDHPLVIETFVDRVDEILNGQNLMNCALCKYREQILGFEAEVGLPQESHHHHVEGILGGEEQTFSQGEKVPAKQADEGVPAVAADLDGRSPSPVAFGDTLSPRERVQASPSVLHYKPSHSHTHGHHPHDHDHDHGHDHHHPYPHADHPLGPRSLKRK